MPDSEQELIRELVSSWIRLGLEYSEGAPDLTKLYIYAASEMGQMYANVFFEQGGVVLYPGKLQGIIQSDDRLGEMQEYLLDDLQAMEIRLEEQSMPRPTEYRVEYEIKPGRLDTQLSYEPKYINHPTRILEDGPEDWLDGRLEKLFGNLMPTDEQRREWQ